jgi:hypothetical protein
VHSLIAAPAVVVAVPVARSFVAEILGEKEILNFEDV